MTAQNNFTIGWLSGETDCKAQTIRYYEQIGLMPEPERSEGNRRLYGTSHVNRLVFIRHSRELGFSLDAIRELLVLCDEPNQLCETADRIARVRLRDVNQRIARLTALGMELERMIEQCRGGQVADCQVIEVLADHAKCLVDDHSNPGPATP